MGAVVAVATSPMCSVTEAKSVSNRDRLDAMRDHIALPDVEVVRAESRLRVSALDTKYLSFALGELRQVHVVPQLLAGVRVRPQDRATTRCAVRVRQETGRTSSWRAPCPFFFMGVASSFI